MEFLGGFYLATWNQNKESPLFRCIRPEMGWAVIEPANPPSQKGE